MKRISLLIAVLPAAIMSGSSHRIAFLRSDHIFVADDDGKNPRQLDSDPRPKGLLSWDSSRNYFSYLVQPVGGEKARAVVIDGAGKQVSEISIRPEGEHESAGLFRFVEGVSWTLDGKMRVWGSVNPSNCEMFDIDIATGRESNGQYWECGTFSLSPDGKHMAGLAPVQHFARFEERFQVVWLDNEDRFYIPNSEPRPVFIPAGPAWSPDSKKLAVLERDAASGEAAIRILLLVDGSTTRIPVPVSILEHPAIAWVGTRVVAGEGPDLVQVDSVTKRLGPVTFDTADELTRMATGRRQKKATQDQIDAVVKKLGGKEAILLQ
jgi:hypothetical protein